MNARTRLQRLEKQTKTRIVPPPLLLFENDPDYEAKLNAACEWLKQREGGGVVILPGKDEANER